MKIHPTSKGSGHLGLSEPPDDHCFQHVARAAGPPLRGAEDASAKPMFDDPYPLDRGGQKIANQG